MGIFKFFKKKKVVVEEVKIKTITRNDLNDWFLERQKDYSEKNKEFMYPVKERISKLCRDLESEIIILENLDFKRKKEVPKVEAIVRENIRNYIKNMQKLMEQLSAIKERSGIIEKVNFVIDKFNRKTDIAYQKIAFLFEKEIRVTKEYIGTFLKDLGEMLKNSSKDLAEFEIIESVQNNILNIQDIKEERLKFLKILNEEILKLKKLKKNLITKEKEISKIIKSDKFLKEEARKKELESKKHKLDREIINLKGKIDFKSLAHFYHQFEKEMGLVKDYKSDFKQTFKSDGSNNLIHLLLGASLSNTEIIESIKKIDELQKEIKEFNIEDFNIDTLNQEIHVVKSSIDSIESEITVKKKKLKHLDDNNEEVFKKVREILKEININVE